MLPESSRMYFSGVAYCSYDIRNEKIGRVVTSCHGLNYSPAVVAINAQTESLKLGQGKFAIPHGTFTMDQV